VIPLTILGPAVAIIGALAIAGIQSVRLSTCKANSAEISAQHKILEARVEEQNAKVTEFEAKARAATQKGRKALQEAQGRIKSAQADRDRLAAALAARGHEKPSEPSSCDDMAKAVQTVRKGLKP
jgi:phage shock protein A